MESGTVAMLILLAGLARAQDKWSGKAKNSDAIDGLWRVCNRLDKLDL